MSNAAGMFSGLLMTVALLAVPGVAVFGLPSAGQAVTGEEAEAGVSLEGAGLGDAVSAAPVSAGAPAFAPLVDAGSNAAAASATAAVPAEAHLDPTSDRRGAAANMAAGLTESTRPVAPAEPRGTAAASVSDEIFGQTAKGASESEASLEAAVAKLNALGIRDVRLTSGEAAGQYYVSCSMKDSRPNVTRRFEAEGATPVAAARDVLAQVEACIATR